MERRDPKLPTSGSLEPPDVLLLRVCCLLAPNGRKLRKDRREESPELGEWTATGGFWVGGDIEWDREPLPEGCRLEGTRPSCGTESELGRLLIEGFGAITGM